MVKFYGLCNQLLYSYIWILGKIPQTLMKKSLATVRHPALNEMSSGHNVIPSWTRTRSMYLFFIGPYHNEKDTKMLPFLFS